MNLIPFFSSYFPVFDTLNVIRAFYAGWRKRYPFYVFLFTGPNETCPSGPDIIERGSETNSAQIYTVDSWIVYNLVGCIFATYMFIISQFMIVF